MRESVVSTNKCSMMLSLFVIIVFIAILTNESITKVHSLSVSASLSSKKLPSWSPCRIELDNVSQSYPQSIWRKLTSSVPRREYAIDQITLSLQNEFILLLGASSSGKSTILKLILGKETPVSGSVTISVPKDKNFNRLLQPPLPVLLDERPLYLYVNSPDTVERIWEQAISSIGTTYSTKNELFHDLAEVLDLSLEQKGSNLSPSECYRCRIGEACLISMLSNQQPPQFQKDQEETEIQSLKHTTAPIILLDEWMDTETSAVTRKVHLALVRLVQRGAIVISVTHKQNLYKTNVGPMRCITLNRGSVLSNTLVGDEDTIL